MTKQGSKQRLEMSREVDSDGSTVLLQNRLAWMEFRGRMAPAGPCLVEEGVSLLAIWLK